MGAIEVGRSAPHGLAVDTANNRLVVVNTVDATQEYGTLISPSSPCS